MKANKKGISLIVLIITIVVIIILAAAIILNLSNTNIITNANNAVAANDIAEVQSAVTIAYGDLYVQKMTPGTDTYTGVEPTVAEVIAALPTTVTKKFTITAQGEDAAAAGTLYLTEDWVVTTEGSKVVEEPAVDPEG